MTSEDVFPDDGWVPLDHIWGDIAEGWFKPDGGQGAFLFRVPRERIETADAGPGVTIEALLDAAFIPKEQVESWRVEGALSADSDLGEPLPSPPAGSTHTTVYVVMKQAAPAQTGPDADAMDDIPLETWQAIESCWKTIVGLETTIDTLRLSMGGLASEMDNAFKKPLATEEKLNANQADVAQWTRAKSRITYALPKVREFVHRATWATAAAERKRLGEIVESHIEPRVPFAELAEVRIQMDHLLKDRQVLLAQGNAVSQECRGILGEVQRAIATLQRNALEKARQKRRGSWDKGKH
jgi:hypothetical protein